MVIRRIRDHVATHNWFAVAVDLAIVVVGVFLGIKATQWNQAQNDRADAAEYRARIISDLKVNEADTEARIAYYAKVRAHAVSALRALHRPQSASGEPLLIDAYQGSQVWLRPFVRTAFDEMVASGVGRNVGDSTTRAALSGYYVTARGFDSTALATTDYRKRLRSVMDFDVQERIRERCGDVVRALPSGRVLIRLSDSCEPGLDPALVAEGVANLYSSPNLKQELTQHIGDLDQKLGLFSRTLGSARSLRRPLERSPA